MAEHDGAEHDVFTEQLGFGFDHQHRVGGAGDDQFELGGLQFGRGRHQDVVAVRVADLGCADRAIERQTGKREGGGGTEQGRDVAVDFRIDRHHGGDDLHFVAEELRKQRTDRAIDQSGGQRFLFGLATLALEEATRDTPACIELFLVVDRQREEVLSFARRLGADRGDQHHGIVDADEDGTAGLASDFARLQCDLMIAVLECLGYFRHVIVVLMILRANIPSKACSCVI